MIRYYVNYGVSRWQYKHINVSVSPGFTAILKKILRKHDVAKNLSIKVVEPI